MTKINQNYLTVKEVHEKYKLSRSTLMRSVNDGKIRKYTFAGGGKVFFEESEILKMFKSETL
ncbi:MAG: helix-turn-helix domain-containing protein [Chitinophagales bacterium]|nr:helix-turn-helix domain-containing protein [Chitinophagales bacterium]